MMSNHYERIFELFLVWCKKENTNYHHDWIWSKDNVWMDGENVTASYEKWMEIKLKNNEVEWL